MVQVRTARLTVLLAGLAASGCTCNHQGTLQGNDALPSAPDLDFGAVPVGQTKALPLVVSNNGTLTLVPQDPYFDTDAGNPGDFRVQVGFDGGIPAGDSQSLTVLFQPSASGQRTAQLLIPSNSNHTPILAVNVTGFGGDVEITASPQPLDFGNVLVGTSVTKTLTLTNQGMTASDPIQIQAIGGPQASDFLQNSTPGVIAASGGTLPISVTFTPAGVGPASASLPVVLCTGCMQNQLAMVGEGVAGNLAFVPSPVSFPTVAAGTHVSQTVTASNTGSYPLLVTGVDLQSGGAAAFTLSKLPSFPQNLSPVGSLADAGPTSFTFEVDYAPTATTGDTATAEAQWESVDGVPTTTTDQLFGNENLNPCTLTFSPPSINFGSATVDAGLKKYLTVGNTGQEQCTLTNLAIDATSDPSFSLPANPMTLNVPASGTAQIEVDFNLQNPGNPLSRKGYLDYDSNDPAHDGGQIPLTAFLRGQSPYSPGWPKYHFDNTDRGQSEADTSNMLGVVLWKFPVATPAQATGLNPLVGSKTTTYMNSPVVGADGTVYQTTLDGQLIAVDASGNEIWSAKIDSPAQDPHPATPIIAADGTLFLEAGTDTLTGGHLYHFDPNGNQLDVVAPPQIMNQNMGGADGFDVCPNIGNDGLLFDGDDLGATAIYSVDSSGKIHQQDATILNYLGERVAVALDTADDSYWCSANGCWAMSSPDAGFAPLWGGTSGAVINSDVGLGFSNSDLAWDKDHTGLLMVMVAAGTGLGSTAATWLTAMDPATGNAVWTYAMPQFTTMSNTSIFNTAAIFTADYGNAAPAIADDGTVYVGNGDGLYAFTFTGTGTSATGALKAGFPFLSADVDSAPAIGGDGTVFFGCSDGTFYAVKPDGTLRFKIVTGGRISSAPAIGPDGTVFFVSDEGNLYAVH